MPNALTRIRRRARPTLAFLMVLTLAAGCSTQESAAADASPSETDASGTASASVSASASPTASETLDADHILGADVGEYALVELPSSLERQARRRFEAAAGLDDDEAKLDIRSLTPRDGAGIGLVLVVTLSPEYAALPGTEQGFASGMAEGVQPDEIALGPTDGYVIETAEQTIVAWQDTNLLVAVFTEQRSAAIDAARAIVEATA